MILIVYILLIILSALTDALFDFGLKDWSKIIECFFIIGLFIIPIKYKRIDWRYLLKLGLIFLFLRIALFDVSYNIFRGLELNFIGSTSPWDDFLIRLKSWQFWFMRGFFMFLALILYFKHLDK